MSSSDDHQDLSLWIGRRQTATDRIGGELVRRFAATFDLPQDMPKAGDVAPPLIHFCIAQPVNPTEQLGADGHPARGGFLPPIELPRRMWAGSEITFMGDLLVDDLVTRTSTIADVQTKTGKSGTLCFMQVEHVIEARGADVVRERQTLVYRGAEPPGTAPKAAIGEPAPSGERIEHLDPSPAFLFRYSALTFNAHRIHYDEPYAREVENYPGLVVHGPLQATLLMQLAQRVRGAPPRQFNFSSRTPVFCERRLHLHARDDESGLRLWTAGEGGPIATMAQATW